MEIKDYIGKEFIGQEEARGILNFYINGQRKNKFLQPILLAAPRGSGKTELARRIAQSLVGEDDKPKKYIEINGASIKQLGNFVEQVIIQQVQDKEITLFIDEIAEVNKEVVNWMLSPLAPNKHGITHAIYNDIELTFDFKRFSVLFATTNPEKLSEAFKSRTKRVELEQYKNPELKKILNLNTPNIKISDDIAKEVVGVARKSPRQIIILSKEIIQYTEQINKKRFEKNDWEIFRKQLSIKPLGLSKKEIELLKILYNRGSQTLTSLAATLELDAKTVRQDIEMYLLNQGLMVIDGKRHLSNKGIKLIRTL